MEEGRFVVAAGEGEVVLRGGFGVVGKVSGMDTGGAFSVVEHPLGPGVLGAPPHTHANEDETSFVIEGEIGVLIGEKEFRAGLALTFSSRAAFPTPSGTRDQTRRGS